MKNFFKYVSILFGITLLLMYFLDMCYSYAFQNGNPRSKIQNILQLTDKHYDIAFFGSSRIEQHVDCELISALTGKSCINFGISGGSPGDMLILMRLAEYRNLSFDQILMQVDYNYNSRGITKYFKANLIPFIDNPVVNNQLENYDSEILYKKIPFYRYTIFDKVVGIREAFASFVKFNHNVDIEISFSPRKGIGMAVAGSFPDNIACTSEELDQMQELYKDTNTKIEFFTAPYCKYVQNREFMEKVKLKLPGLHNYIKLFDNHDNYFSDCGHLNDLGARAFTQVLVEDLIK